MDEKNNEYFRKYQRNLDFCLTFWYLHKADLWLRFLWLYCFESYVLELCFLESYFLAPPLNGIISDIIKLFYTRGFDKHRFLWIDQKLLCDFSILLCLRVCGCLKHLCPFGFEFVLRQSYYLNILKLEYHLSCLDFA